MMLHSLPGGMLEKFADVLELEVMGIAGAGSGSPHKSMQALEKE